MKRGAFPLAALALFAILQGRRGALAAEPALAPARACPSEMARVGAFCVDRWEASAIDEESGRTLSPYYPPIPSLSAEVYRGWLLEREQLGTPAAAAMPLPPLSDWERAGHYRARAVSRPSVVPQGYVSQVLARAMCERSSKRLCTEREWVTACAGLAGRKYPYGSSYRAGACNIFRGIHPASALHASPSLGHRDPRLNLVREEEAPLLRKTGETPDCASRGDDGAIYDMVGNLDEWVEEGSFRGGFYARSTSQGCEAKVSVHAPAYYDYSTGARCCKNAR